MAEVKISYEEYSELLDKQEKLGILLNENGPNYLVLQDNRYNGKNFFLIKANDSNSFCKVLFDSYLLLRNQFDNLSHENHEMAMRIRQLQDNKK